MAQAMGTKRGLAAPEGAKERAAIIFRPVPGASQMRHRPMAHAMGYYLALYEL
jgi:hypothetical protein